MHARAAAARTHACARNGANGPYARAEATQKAAVLMDMHHEPLDDDDDGVDERADLMRARSPRPRTLTHTCGRTVAEGAEPTGPSVLLFDSTSFAPAGSERALIMCAVEHNPDGQLLLCAWAAAAADAAAVAAHLADVAQRPQASAPATTSPWCA